MEHVGVDIDVDYYQYYDLMILKNRFDSKLAGYSSQ